MAKREKLAPADVADALRAVNGLVFLAAERLGVTARTVYNYAQRHPAVRDALEHQKGRRLDTAEAALWKAVLGGEAWAVCFYLKTQGKARGYVERVETDNTHRVFNRLVIEEEVVEHADGPPPAPLAPGPG